MAQLRLTGGVARGRRLPAAVPGSARPTSSRVREALFSMVGHDLAGLRVLDAFGGSGLLGLEAWSRGAEVTLVERDRTALRAIRANIEGLGAACTVRPGDLFRVAPTLQPFDGVLADPPYADGVDAVLAVLEPLVMDWLVLEAASDRVAPARVGGLVLDRERHYGGTRLVLYRREV